MGLSFEERWKRVLERYLQRVRNDEGIKALRKKGDKLAKKLRGIDKEIDNRRVKVLSEEVKKEFAEG